MPAAGEDGSRGPADAGEEDEDGAEELAGSEIGVSRNVRPEEYGDAEDAERDSGNAAGRELICTVADALKDEKPERGDGDKQSGETGGDVGFRPSQYDVGGDEEKDSDDGEANEITTGDGNAVPAKRPDAEHEQAGDGEAESSHDEGSEVINGDSNGEVGGAPEDIYKRESDDDVQPSGRIGESHGIAFNFIRFQREDSKKQADPRSCAAHL